MKQFTILLCVALCFGCATTKKINSKSNELEGTWIPIKQVYEGTELPKALFEKQQLIIQDTSYTVIAESVDKGTVKYMGNKMDIFGKDGVNKGKHFTAIYKLENDELTLCYNLQGDTYPENFETKGKAKYFLSVFKKQ